MGKQRVNTQQPARFEVDVDGRILGEAEALREVTLWMVARYRESVAYRSGVGSSLLMGFLKVCADSVRIREAVGVSLPQVPSAPPVTLVSTAQAAAVMGCSAQWVRHLAQTGRVPARRVGRAWLIELAQED